jgi:hypothetical protein
MAWEKQSGGLLIERTIWDAGSTLWDEDAIGPDRTIWDGYYERDESWADQAKSTGAWATQSPSAEAWAKQPSGADTWSKEPADSSNWTKQ